VIDGAARFAVQRTQYEHQKTCKPCAATHRRYGSFGRDEAAQRGRSLRSIRIERLDMFASTGVLRACGAGLIEGAGTF